MPIVYVARNAHIYQPCLQCGRGDVKLDPGTWRLTKLCRGIGHYKTLITDHKEVRVSNVPDLLTSAIQESLPWSTHQPTVQHIAYFQHRSKERLDDTQAKVRTYVGG